MEKQSNKSKKESLLERFLNRNKNKEIAVKTDKITIFYDANLEKITGTIEKISELQKTSPYR